MGPSQNNLQPVLKPYWNLQFFTHTYRNPDFAIKSSSIESWQCGTRPVLENLPPVQTPFLQCRVSTQPFRTSFFHPGLLFDPWPGVKGAISEKLRTVPRPCWILLICLAHARNLTSPSWAQGLGETICPHAHFWKNDRRFRGPLDTYWFFIGVSGATLFQFGCHRMSITEIISEIENPWSRKGHTTNHWNISNSPNLPQPDHWNTCNLAKRSLKYLQFA